MDILVNSRPRAVRPDCPLPELLQELGFQDNGSVVWRNGAKLPYGEYGGTVLREGDRLEIVVLNIGG